jgi:tetratricopeptide (TPR) repeat protein
MLDAALSRDSQTVRFRSRVYSLLLFLAFGVLPSCVATEMAPSGRTEFHANNAELYYEQGLEVLAHGDRVGSVALFERAMAADPDYVRPLRYAAVIAHQVYALDRPKDKVYREKARQYAEKLLAVDHETADAHYILAMLNYSTNYDEALLHFHKFVTAPINPKESLVGDKETKLGSSYEIMGYIYALKKDYKNCLACLKNFIARCARDPVYAKRVARTESVIAKLENYFKSKTMYEASVGKEPALFGTDGAGQPASPPKPAPVKTPIIPAAAPKTLAPAAVAPPAHTPKPAVAKQEFEKATRELDKALEERTRQIELLTG